MISLEQAFLSIDSIELCRAFLKDLCTPKELKVIAERWQVAQLLYQNQYSYRDIHKMTGASLTTIGRVARFLNEENFKGYQQIINKLQQR